MQKFRPPASRAEQIVGRFVRAVGSGLPEGAAVNASAELRDALQGLEYFIPEVLRQIDSMWENESLDGFLPLYARKSGERELEVYGLCVIISDQTLTPLHLRVRAAESRDEVEWMRCRLGEAEGGQMTRRPYSRVAVAEMLTRLEGRTEHIDWVYRVEFGHQPSGI
jgi:hypothetical protein